MTNLPSKERKFSDEEVALIIKRAAELQQTEQVEQDPGSTLSLAEVEQIATEAGIDPRLIRRAAQGLDRPQETNRPAIATAYAVARTIFVRMASRREEGLRKLMDNLEARVVEAVASRAPSDQISAGSTRSLPNGEAGTATG